MKFFNQFIYIFLSELHTTDELYMQIKIFTFIYLISFKLLNSKHPIEDFLLFIIALRKLRVILLN